MSPWLQSSHWQETKTSVSSTELGVWESGPSGGWWGLSSQRHSPDTAPTPHPHHHTLSAAYWHLLCVRLCAKGSEYTTCCWRQAGRVILPLWQKRQVLPWASSGVWVDAELILVRPGLREAPHT